MNIDTYTKPYIKKTSNHLYIPPTKALEHSIAHYTITFKNPKVTIDKDSVLHLIPDLSGCIVILLDTEIQARIWGPTTKVVTLSNDLNTAKERFFIEFLPGGLYSFLPISMDTIVNQQMNMKEVAPLLYKEIVQCITTSSTYDRIVEKMNTLCESYIKRYKEDPVYRAFITYVQEEKEWKLQDFVKALHVSERQIHRYFKKYIGITYNTYRRISSINNLIPTLTNQQFLDIAYDNDYFDQAHFNHVFKEVCKTTPSKYIENMSEFYNEIYKF